MRDIFSQKLVSLGIAAALMTDKCGKLSKSLVGVMFKLLPLFVTEPLMKQLAA